MKIGDVVLKVTMARFSRTLSSLVAAGVDIIKALEITGQAAGNVVVEEALAEVRERVQEGVPIAQPLMENPIFPPMISHMVKVGEETGELEAMLSKIADFYEEEVDSAIQSLTSIIEPVMIIFVGAMVGLIILSMYLPLFKLYSLIESRRGGLPEWSSSCARAGRLCRRRRGGGRRRGGRRCRVQGALDPGAALEHQAGVRRALRPRPRAAEAEGRCCWSWT